MPEEKKKAKKEEKPEETKVLEETEEPVGSDEDRDVVAPVDDEVVSVKPAHSVDLDAWKPKTAVGMAVKKGEIANIDGVLDKGYRIMEAEIVDILMPGAESELLLIGQSKGKFGGGQRRVFRQTQKKTKEGNKPSFATYAVVGDRNGHVGLGYGKAKETVPAREKAIRNAKLNVMKIRRGCGSWQCNCKEPHSIPFKIHGKCGSIEIDIIPAPKGTGLVTETEVQKILAIAGVSDAWCKTRGKTTSRINLIKAAQDAMKQLTSMKVQSKHVECLNISD
ncbi:TPA: 30S ribosomal protein S5 [Candidatus Woesearchaeota archaeon]|nr:30S ribosomal protein S5 [Candidatus Woesearchaeota archaeon]